MDSLGTSAISEQDINKLLEKELQFGNGPCCIGLGDICKEDWEHRERNTRTMKQTGDSEENFKQSLVKETLPTNIYVRHSQSNGYSKSVGKVASPEKLWDGCLQLNPSVTMSSVAFFNSGEKMPHVKWFESVEVKGKVKLEDFEKYIQELPRSRNRGLMVISLCWKVGSSKAGLAGMRKVAKGYKEGNKVGIAQLSPGIHLYVCPRSETIITILAKHGFFKGMTAIEDNKDSFIGCIVWRRNQINLHSVEVKSERKNQSLPDQPLNSYSNTARQQISEIKVPCLHPDLESFSIPSRTDNSTLEATSKDRIERNNEDFSEVSVELLSSSTSSNSLVAHLVSSGSPSGTRGPKTSYSDSASQQVSEVQLSKVESSLAYNSGQEQYKQNLEPKMRFQSDVTKQPLFMLDSDDLPEFDFSTSGLSQTKNNSMDEATVGQKLPNEGCQNKEGSVPPRVPIVKLGPASYHKRLEGLDRQILPADDNHKMPPQKKICERDGLSIVPLVEEKKTRAVTMPCSTTVSVRTKNLFDDGDDMPEWCPSDVNLQNPKVLGTNPSSEALNHDKEPMSTTGPRSSILPRPPIFTHASHFTYLCPQVTMKQPESRSAKVNTEDVPSVLIGVNSVLPGGPQSNNEDVKLPNHQGGWRGWTP
ncbi:SPOC domain / Transcription elongation factor S-II protein [Quillaja saponaria]|uniref:SPOC domain / Transcription elongation factor S-II protein n=1 Tax=Quillaja saponaria TaxID=32244 RepID=A0AAD7PJ16_QUISA|nr:SPOC domain / Transcription elongation factor S-II protein [Quillaja saponaria]